MKRKLTVLLVMVSWALVWHPACADGPNVAAGLPQTSARNNPMLLARLFGHRATPTPTPAPTPLVVPTTVPTSTPVATPTPPATATPTAAPSVSPPIPDQAFHNLKLPIGDAQTYLITWMGIPVGYSHYQVERQVELGGESFYVINSTARLKLGSGTIPDTEFHNKLIISATNFKPSYYYTMEHRGHATQVTEVLYSKNLIAEKNEVGKQVSSFAYDVDAAPWLFDNNVWGRIDACVEHYLILAMTAHAAQAPIPAYDPVLQGGGRVEFKNPTRATVKLPDGQKTSATVYTMTDLQGAAFMRVAVEADHPRILWLQQVGGGLRFELAGAAIVASADTWSGVDVAKAQVLPSKIFFADPEGLREVKVAIKAQVRNPTLLTHHVVGFEQTFSGQVSPDGAVDGTITVHTTPATVLGSTGHPMQGQDLAGMGDPRYLRSELGIESEAPSIRNKSLELTWKVPSAWVAARRVADWVHQNIKAGTAPPSARLVLAASQGNAEDRALLTTALCRAAGIPARSVGGLIFEQGNFVPHVWVEVYVGPEGWVALDPDTGEQGALSACHVALWERGGLVSGSLQVTDYSPKPDRKVAFFSRDITWPVGEERLFILRRGNKVVGQETAWLDLGESAEGDDLYRFTSKVDLTDAKRAGQSTVSLSSEALPLAAHYQGNLAPDLAGTSVVFDKNNIVIKTGGSAPKSQEIPYSKGVYLADGRFLSQLALVLGQAPGLKIGKKVSVSVFRPEALSIRKMDLEVRGDEVLVKGADSWETWRCEGPDGLVVNIDKESHQVDKIIDPKSGYELDFDSSKLKL